MQTKIYVIMTTNVYYTIVDLGQITNSIDESGELPSIDMRKMDRTSICITRSISPSNHTPVTHVRRWLELSAKFSCQGNWEGVGICRRHLVVLSKSICICAQLQGTNCSPSYRRHNKCKLQSQTTGRCNNLHYCQGQYHMCPNLPLRKK